MPATTIPAPVGGLNDRDSIADMKPSEAVVMENWWPYPSYLGVRKGYTNHVTGFSSAVETLVEYLPVTGVSTKFAAAGTSIYNVTTAGALGAAVQTGLTNARFQDAAITTAGGSYIYLVNGVDKPRLWDGATWVAVDGVSVPAITGATTTQFVHACLYKNRLFFTQTQSLKVAYLPTLSVGGAAAFVDLGSVFRLGGYVMGCYTWTIDAGNGSDDHFVVISSNGEVAVYTGTDPSTAATWNLVGVFTLGRPLGRRCAIKFGGDLAVNTLTGVYPLSKGLLSSSVDRRIALTDKIQNSVSLEASSYSGNFGWQLCLYPDLNMLIINVPGMVKYQYAQNLITGAWTKFTGWTANVWLNASDGLYFGDSTGIRKAWQGYIDGTTYITADILPAFNYFGNKAFNKYFTMVRPYILTSGSPSVIYGLNVNLTPADVSGVLSYTPPTGMVWGTMTWGSMVWGGSLTSIGNWNTVGSIANNAATRLKVQNNNAEVRFSAIDYVYQASNGVL